MEFTKEQMIAATEYAVGDTFEIEGKSFTIVDRDEWTQDHKFQTQETIFSYSGKFYSIEEYREGSPFTDWYYGSEDWGEEVEAVEVEKVEVVSHIWRAV